MFEETMHNEKGGDVHTEMQHVKYTYDLDSIAKCPKPPRSTSSYGSTV